MRVKQYKYLILNSKQKKGKMNVNFNFFSTRYPTFERFIAFVQEFVQEKLINNFKVKQRCLFS